MNICLTVFNLISFHSLPFIFLLYLPFTYLYFFSSLLSSPLLSSPLLSSPLLSSSLLFSPYPLSLPFYPLFSSFLSHTSFLPLSFFPLSSITLYAFLFPSSFSSSLLSPRPFFCSFFLSPHLYYFFNLASAFHFSSLQNHYLLICSLSFSLLFFFSLFFIFLPLLFLLFIRPLPFSHLFYSPPLFSSFSLLSFLFSFLSSPLHFPSPSLLFSPLPFSSLHRFSLLCTALGLPSDVAHFLNCGADRVLLKPLDVQTFAQAMKKFSKSRKM